MKPILCLDFDGVLHSYISGWQGADTISDPPVDGAIRFIEEASKEFEIHIFSSRSHQEGGIRAMQCWILDSGLSFDTYREIKWPLEKPPAMISLDDRAITFTGTFPKISDLIRFKPWNKIIK